MQAKWRGLQNKIAFGLFWKVAIASRVMHWANNSRHYPASNGTIVWGKRMNKALESKSKRHLSQACLAGLPVVVERGDQDWGGWVTGYVASVGRRWVVLQQVVDGIFFDGFDVFRLADVIGVEVMAEEGYVQRGVRGSGGRPAATFTIAEGSGDRQVVEAAGNFAPVFSVFLERSEGTPRLVGSLGETFETSFEFRLIGPDGVWAPQPYVCPYAEVTSISCGGRYESALRHFGDPQPEIWHPTTPALDELCTCGDCRPC